jgi:hypothetical protein
MTAANDLSVPKTIAGRAFSIRNRGGGLLNLRVALQDSTASEFARDLTALSGVRIVMGPGSLGRGDCFLAHCPGFKAVFSADESDGSMSALVSRVPTEAGSEKTSELSAMLTLLMQEQLSKPDTPSPWRPGFTAGKLAKPSPIPGAAPVRQKAFSAASVSGKKKPSPSSRPLRQAALRPGKPLARTTPLVRHKPLRRSRGKP